MDEDPFWGPGFWEDIESRAATLENGIQQLVRQCHELGHLVSRSDSLQNSSPSKFLARTVKPHLSKLAGAYSSFGHEGTGWVEKIVLGYWSTILADTAEVSRKRSISNPPMQS